MTGWTYFIRHSCYNFIRWPYSTWPSPWRVLSMSPLLIWHLRHPFRNTFAVWSIYTLVWSGLGSRLGENVSFHLWPDIGLLKKGYHCVRFHSLQCSARYITRLAPSVSSKLGGGGGGGTSSLANWRWREAPAPRGSNRIWATHRREAICNRTLVQFYQHWWSIQARCRWLSFHWPYAGR